eukprot:gene35396-43643_t
MIRHGQAWENLNPDTTEIMRASIGTDVCNYRHSVLTPTNKSPLSAPWASGCKQLPTESLTDLYFTSEIKAKVKFSFPIRPPGGLGFGLFSDEDSVWRSDSVDDTHVSRSQAFISALFDRNMIPQESTAGPYSSTDGRVVGLVTHGEMVSAVYEALGVVDGYSPKNAQVVPILIEEI